MKTLLILSSIGLVVFLIGLLLWGYHLFFDYDNLDLLETASKIVAIGASIYLPTTTILLLLLI